MSDVLGAVVLKDLGYVVDPAARNASEVLTFDPGVKLLDAAAAASYVVEIADDEAGIPDDKLVWQAIAEINWVGGNTLGYGGVVRAPNAMFDTAPLKGKRVRWRTVTGNVGLTSAARSSK